MDEVELERTQGSTAIEVQVGEPLQDPSGVDKTATTLLLGDDASAEGASPENGGKEEEVARLLPEQGAAADALGGEEAAGSTIMVKAGFGSCTKLTPPFLFALILNTSVVDATPRLINGPDTCITIA